jgi:hypothetical protein
VIWKGFEYCKDETELVAEISKHSSTGFILYSGDSGSLPGTVLVVFVVDKVALWHVSLRVLRVYPVSIILPNSILSQVPSILHNFSN